jgi:tetratricopeptide (TPR) repeat protein
MASKAPSKTPVPSLDGRPMTSTLKYNPHLWSDDELRAIFVVRQKELAELTERIRGMGKSTSGTAPQHIIVSGARGMGKSTLLRRLALAVSDDAQLKSNWIALNFPEEQYTVARLSELWSNVLDALLDALDREHADRTDTAKLEAEAQRIAALEESARESATLEALTQWSDSHRRRLLLLIDSTDLLFANLARAGDEKPAKRAPANDNKTTTASNSSNNANLWRLRAVLTHQPQFLWIGASYASLESGHSYADAFHDFFDLMELRTLSEAEMSTALLALAERFGQTGSDGTPPARRLENELKARPERLRALRAITGGNPRTTVMLYDLFAANAPGDLHSDLRGLLDIMTPLYKARMEHLADQARKVLAHVMEHWAPITLKELQNASNISNTTLSSQLKRLETEGLVEKTRISGTSRAGYQVGERFFNIWYLMRLAPRRMRQRLMWLVEFMRLWYRPDELAALADIRISKHRSGTLQSAGEMEFSMALAGALERHSIERYRLETSVFSQAIDAAEQSRKSLEEICPELFDPSGEDRPLVNAADYLKRFAALDEKLRACPHVPPDKKADWTQLVKGEAFLTLPEKEQIANSAADWKYENYENVQKLLSETDEFWAKRFGKKAFLRFRSAIIAGEFFPDCPDVELAGRQIVASFGTNARLSNFALQLLSLRNRTDETALSPFIEQLAKRFPKDIALQTKYGEFLSKTLRRFEEAEKTYRALIKIDPKNTQAWTSLGHLLSDHLACFSEAQTAYLKAIELGPTSTGAWFGLTKLRAIHLSSPSDAETACRKAIEVNPKNSGALFALGVLLMCRHSHYDEAEITVRRAMEINPTIPSPFQTFGRLYALQGHTDAASRAYRDALAVPQNLRTYDSEPAEIELEANLWLNNQDSALHALDQLAERALKGHNKAFYALRAQASECASIGLGLALAELMEKSAWANYLEPFSIALRATTGDKAALTDAPAETRVVAEDILREIEKDATAQRVENKAE